MTERFSPDDAGYVLYTDMVDRLQARFPAVPLWRLEQIVSAEHDAITGGLLRIVPMEVETGAAEMLEREQNAASGDGEVA